MRGKALGRADAGWQYALADLSLILFMVCALALAQAPKGKLKAMVQPAPEKPQSVALAEPTAVWRAGPGASPPRCSLPTGRATPRSSALKVQHST